MSKLKFLLWVAPKVLNLGGAMIVTGTWAEIGEGAFCHFVPSTKLKSLSQLLLIVSVPQGGRCLGVEFPFHPPLED